MRTSNVSGCVVDLLCCSDISIFLTVSEGASRVGHGREGMTARPFFHGAILCISWLIGTEMNQTAPQRPSLSGLCADVCATTVPSSSSPVL